MVLPFAIVNTISMILSFLAILGCRIDRVHSHSFMLGNDGTLEAVGYDVNTGLSGVTIKKTYFLNHRRKLAKFHSPTTKIIIPDGRANSFDREKLSATTINSRNCGRTQN